MSWKTPKIDWTPSDYFNVEDWERIRINLQIINDILRELHMPDATLKDLTLSRGVLSLPTVSSVNDLEYNLQALFETLNIPLHEHKDPKEWHARLSSLYATNPNNEDWIRWETFTKRAKECLDYMNSYEDQRVLGTFYAGTLGAQIQHLSRGR